MSLKLMKTPIILFFFLMASSVVALAQAGGNIGYGQGNGRARAELNERNKRISVAGEPAPGSNSMFLDATVLMNVKADEYVAVFGVSQEGVTVAECHQKM